MRNESHLKVKRKSEKVQLKSAFIPSQVQYSRSLFA